MNKELRRKNFQILFSVVAAVALWLFVVFMENPAITMWERNVEVDVVGERVLQEQGLVMIKASTPLVDVKLSGTRQGFYEKKDGDVTARIDVSDITAPGVYTVDVDADVKTRGASVRETSPSQMEIVVEPLVTVEKTVKVATTGTCADGFSVVEVETPVVQLTGPESIVKSLSLEADPVTVEGASGDITLRSNIHMINESGKKVFRDDCIMGAQAITVTCKVRYEKTVPVSADVIGSAAVGYEYNIRMDLSEVHIFGERTLLERIENVKTEPVDITGITEPVDMVVSLVLPDGVTVQEGTKVTVTVQPILVSSEVPASEAPTDFAEIPENEE